MSKNEGEITREQYSWLVNKGIIHEGMMVNLNNCDYIDFKITKIFPCNDDKTPLIEVQNMENDRVGLATYNSITGIEYMDVNRFVKAYEVDDEINTLNVIKKTNVENTIIGKETAKVNGQELKDGMKIILHNDLNPKLCNKPLTVKGVGSSIKLIAPRGRPKKIK